MTEYKSVINWDDIRGSLERELGEDNHGWIDQIEIGLRQLRHEIDAGNYLRGEAKLPVIVQIKQKWGDLRIYADGTEAMSVRSALDDICRQVSKTCERCGNAAHIQQIAGYAARLCCHCYNKFLDERFEGAEARWPADLANLDIAERFPDLVSPNCASLVAICGPGWQIPLVRGLQKMERAVLDADLPLGTVQISDIKEKWGRLSILFHYFHPVVLDIEQQIEFETNQTCILCGHYGGRHRSRRTLACLCDHCLFEQSFEARERQGK